jgi:hypothetical protein
MQLSVQVQICEAEGVGSLRRAYALGFDHALEKLAVGRDYQRTIIIIDKIVDRLHLYLIVPATFLA